MLPGPDRIIACPHCGGLARHFTLTSGNTFGMRVWTDGKREAPMLPRPPAIVRCRQCSAFYWLAEARHVGELASRWMPATSGSSNGTVQQRDGAAAQPAEWLAAESIEELSETEYYDALRSGLAKDHEQERSLRVLAWWRGNDEQRHAERRAVEPGRSDEYRANVRALVGLLADADADDRIMKAEAHRELGDFAAAMALLAGVSDEPYGMVADQIRALGDAGDSCVHELEMFRRPR